MQKYALLSIDDDKQVQFLLQEYFEEEGHTVFCANTGKDALAMLKDNQVDVVLLDLVLPDFDGLSLMREIRQVSNAAIIVVSGKGATTDKIIGLELGADDYISKPFSLRETDARIKTVLRRNAANNNGAVAPVADTAGTAEDISLDGRKIVFEGWTLDTSRLELFSPQQEKVPITTGEYRLLEIFLKAPNRVLSREYIYDQIHEGNFDVYDRSIDIQLGRLRKKLDDDPADPKLIRTVRGAGYMFIGKIDS